MGKGNFGFADADEVSKRLEWYYEFVERMFDEEDRPIFVSDEACLYDIHAGDDDELAERCDKWYGRRLSKSDFLIPIWKLLDILYVPDGPAREA